jgi:hypothetical protein
MRKSRFCVFLIAILLLAPRVSSWATPDSPFVLAVPYGPPIQLLQDTAFNNGFRAFWSCSNFPNDVAGLGHLGDCVDYYTPYVNTQGRNYEVHTWPDTEPAHAGSDANKYWNFTEGLHRGFRAYGYEFGPAGEQSQAKDLAVHMLEANRENGSGGLAASSPDLIWLQSMNNLPSTDPMDPNPHYGGLVRTVSSDRHGTIMTYMNTQNEIRNIAYTYAYANALTFAYDTWPTFVLEQNFKKAIDLATLSQLIINADVEIPFVQVLPGFPGDFINATYSIGVALRRKDPANGHAVVFLGYILYSSIGENERFGGDQFSQAFYDGPNQDVGGYITPGAPPRTISFDLRALLDKAIAYSNGALGSFVWEDYYLVGIGVGWETVGYHEVKSQISGVSAYGSPRMLFDSEVYEESADPNQPSIYKAWNNPGGSYSEGEMRAHWVKWGCKYGLVASTTFDVKVYMDRWGAVGDPATGNSVSYYNFMPQCYEADGSRNYECAVDHYVIYGRDAGHPGHW